MDCPHCESANDPAASACADCRAPLPPPAAQHGLGQGSWLKGNAYRVDDVLGQGGFGITYLCHDDALDRRVAIKEFFPEGATRQGDSVVPSARVSPLEYDNWKGQFREEARRIRAAV